MSRDRRHAVRKGPAITTQPEGSITVAGKNAIFRVAAGGTQPLSFQWRKNGVDLPRETGRVLLLPDTTPSDGGIYSVVVSNAAGSVTSAAATLTVIEGPAVVTQPEDQTAIAGEPARFTVIATGTGPLAYQWRNGGADIPGATSGTLVLANVQTSDIGKYRVEISNLAGSVTSAAAQLAVLELPVVTEQPLDEIVRAGRNVTLSVTATGTTPLSYQWRKDGADLTGETSRTLRVQKATPADAGTYQVVVSNSAGSVTSNSASLTVQ